MSELYLDGLCMRYGSRAVLDNVSLTVASGTALSLLGPSGTGKSTLLGIAAGLLTPDAGRVHLDGRDITALPPETRGMGMVFQDAALFPHLTVADNVAFGLKMRGLTHKERMRQARAMLERVELAEKAGQWPETLSGGEQQRVALARALVVNPAVLLLDEPFARLDPRLRQDMRRLVRKLRHELGTTMLTVTHDGTEALTDGDTVAVLLDGKLVQNDTPQALYEQPVSETVARFFGEINVLKRDGATLLIRPDQVRCTAASAAGALASGYVASLEYAGNHTRMEVQTLEGLWVVYAPSVTSSDGSPVAPWSTGDHVAICRKTPME